MASGRLYSLDVAGWSKLDGKMRKQITSMKGQAKVIFDEMIADRSPRLVADIAKAVESKLETTQTAVKVVTFYVVKWRSEGIVKSSTPDVDNESVDIAFDELVAKITAEDDEQEALARAEGMEE